MLPQARSAESRSQFERRPKGQPRSPIETACSRLRVQVVDYEVDNLYLNDIGMVPLEQVENNYVFQTQLRNVRPCTAI